VAPPPTSRKFAGDPPKCLMMSMVAMASPAPFTMQPMLPSSLMKFRSNFLASISEGSSSSRSRRSSSSRWRNRALSSKLILQSRARTLPSVVTTSGLISTSAASTSMKAWYSLMRKPAAFLAASPLRPSP
jgi:hypothetical protein